MIRWPSLLLAVSGSLTAAEKEKDAAIANAKRIALEEIPGQFVKVECGTEQNKEIFCVEIIRAGEKLEVQIDALSGDILRVGAPVPRSAGRKV